MLRGSTSNLHLTSRSKMSRPVSWSALVVDQVNEETLLTTIGKDADLPVQAVLISDSSQLSEIAVLSWRWDGKYRIWGSRNVVAALRHCKNTGIKYLFIDAIAIDQKLPGPELLAKVTSFSKLYTTIPVVAAYDHIGTDFRLSIRRPWILSEARSFKFNTTKIIYVGHNIQGAELQWSYRIASFECLKESQQTTFVQMLDEIWSSSFTTTVLGVLVGGIGMCSISDFRFIIPTLAPILIRAYNVLERNDYLLTVAILCQACFGYVQAIPASDKDDVSFVAFGENIAFGRYNISPYFERGIDLRRHVSLDGKKIAEIDTVMRGSPAERFSLKALEGAESTVFEALGCGEEEWGFYTAKADERKGILGMTWDSGSNVPQIEIHSVTL